MKELEQLEKDFRNALEGVCGERDRIVQGQLAKEEQRLCVVCQVYNKSCRLARLAPLMFHRFHLDGAIVAVEPRNCPPRIVFDCDDDRETGRTGRGRGALEALFIRAMHNSCV